MLSSATSRGPASAPPVVQLSWAEQGTALQALPVDRSRTEGVRAVRGFTYALVDPTPVARPHLLLARWGGPGAGAGRRTFPTDTHSTRVRDSAPALQLLDVDVATAQTDAAFVEAVAGNRLLPGSVPYAHNYAGHQVR
jgi:hypothetical protein